MIEAFLFFTVVALIFAVFLSEGFGILCRKVKAICKPDKIEKVQEHIAKLHLCVPETETQEQEEKRMKSEARDELANKFLFISELREYWSGLHRRKYTFHIVNADDKIIGKVPLQRCHPKNPHWGRYYNCPVCPIEEYMRPGSDKRGCENIEGTITGNYYYSKRVNDDDYDMDKEVSEILDAIEAFLVRKYKDVIKPEKQEDELDRMIADLDVDWDKNDQS
jgi:hypothetical protein